MNITVTRPKKNMTEFRSDGTGKKQLRNPYVEEKSDGPVMLAQLLTGMAITKDYGPYVMTYSRAEGFGKYMKGEGRVTPDKYDIIYFRRAMNRAAHRDPAIRSFLEHNPGLKLESWQL